MTKPEKLKAITDRLGEKAKDFQSIHISVLIIMGWMEALFKAGVISEGPTEITETGQEVIALCDEFDWKPSDTEIVTFCKDMVQKEQLESFVLMLREMRDNQKQFLTNARKHIGY